MSGAGQRPADEPWWASGVDDIAPEPDPLAAHRRARSDDDPETDGATPWEDWDERDERPPDGAVRSTLEDALEGLAALARAAGRRGRQSGQGGVRAHDPTCRGCPWCTLLRSLGDARPEVTENLEQAARHVVLAARAWVDAAEQRTAWEPIPLDDDEDEEQQ